MVIPVGSPLGYFIIIFLGLALFNSFGTQEEYLVIVSLVILTGLIICAVEGSLVVLSLVIPLGYLLEYPNPGADLYGTLLGAAIGLWFGSDVVWGVGISCVPTSGAFITSKMNSVSYF